MRIVAISDTHGLQRNLANDAIPECDVLVHAGDITTKGEVRELYAIATWLKRQVAKHIIIIAGNHDGCFQTQPQLAVESLVKEAPGRIIYLRDQGIVIDGVKFYGSPWQPAFCNWHFNLPRNGPALEACWAQIPDDTDVLITHGPPHGVLDQNLSTIHCGCEKLIARVQDVKPKVHIFGHIHNGYGQAKIDETLFVNAAIADERYELTNKPIVINV